MTTPITLLLLLLLLSPILCMLYAYNLGSCKIDKKYICKNNFR